MPERELVKAVITYLNARGAFAWRNQSGMLRGEHKGKPWVVRMGTKGMPDVLAVWQGHPAACVEIGCAYPDHQPQAGRLIAVECKRGKNKPTADQERVMGELRKRGALVIVARDITDVERALTPTGPTA